MNKKKILSFLIFILIAPAVYSIGVGLWVEEVQFTPNLNANFDAFVNNNADYDTRVKLTARGGLAEYIIFSDEYLDISAGGRVFFTFNLKLPESIPPGRNRIDIGATEVTSSGGGGISAKTAVYMGFYVRAPYPGKYIEAEFSAPDVEENQIVTFNIDLISRGNETISKIDGIIEIFDDENKVDVISFGPVFDVNPGESRTIKAEWDSTGQKVGEYAAKAVINYDSNQLVKNTKFRIGTLLVKIINYTKEFYKDEINKFDIQIQSLWNTAINDVYGEIEVNKQKIKTLKIDLAPWSKTNITAYLDTTNIDLGEHIAYLKVFYSNNVAAETGKITVLPKKEKVVEMPSGIPSTTVLLVVIIILLVVGNLVLIIHFLKPKGTSKRKMKKK